MTPLIYFSYGMTKSGSTLAYELARSALVLGGLAQPRLSLAAVEDRKKINFCNHIDASQADAIRQETRDIGHTVAIKTHTRPDPDVVKMLESGEAFAHAIYRDPRDMALSMIDHGSRSRANGKPGFIEFFTPEDTVDNLRHQSNSLLAWLSLPNVRPFFYDDFAFDMPLATRTLIDELGVEADPAEVMGMATQDRFTQKNKAKPARHKTEMDPDISARFEAVFAPFYDKLVKNRDTLPLDGRPVLDATQSLCDWSL